MTGSTSSSTPTLPRAAVRPRRRWSLAWLITIAAVGFAGWLAYQAWTMRGERIMITFDDGHGLRVGDDLRYLGIIVGEVEAITLDDDGSSVVVEASILSDADHIARRGTRFWIVRPRIGPGGVSGLDALVGPRYIAVRPGGGPRRDTFVGLSEPPVVEDLQPDDLEVLLVSDRRGSLQPGAPVTYRQVRVGTVVTVALASDAGAVEARLHIEQPYAPLIRPETKFWDIGGVDFFLGITGVTVDVESLSSLMLGGVALATPPDAGEQVTTGHRFTLHHEVDEDWLAWQPNVPLGSELLPPGSRVPSPERARLAWKETILRMRKARTGWVLQTDAGLLGPTDLLTTDEDAREDSSSLEVAGQAIDLSNPLVWEGDSVAVLQASIGGEVWPTERMRSPGEIQDCLIVAGDATRPTPLAATRLEARDGWWKVDEALSFDESMHGGCVLSRRDGALIGVLLVADGVGRVALLPDDFE